ncbi:MAG: pantoate--beta-alanine ligase [Acidocella sp. 20-58-15]|nr:MAG: pantoate--beta-alanine ligase [Acidocella sp. 20-58-15]
MLIARTINDLNTARATLGAALGFVPTMGALHEGHLALIEAAKANGAKVAASIFVNPTQFGPNEDFSRYPRTEDADLEKLAAAGCHLVWLPNVATMYPPNAATTITLTGPATNWEGAIRPGHFAGVATVVAKLFGQVRPSHAYFGEKDFQQVQVITRMVSDLLLPVEIIAIPTIREPDGLALSSRNRFLSPEDRARAPMLYATLRTAATAISAGEDITKTIDSACNNLTAAGLAPDYFNLVDARSLEPITSLTAPARILTAAKLGPIRLLDNIAVG